MGLTRLHDGGGAGRRGGPDRGGAENPARRNRRGATVPEAPAVRHGGRTARDAQERRGRREERAGRDRVSAVNREGSSTITVCVAPSLNAGTRLLFDCAPSSTTRGFAPILTLIS